MKIINLIIIFFNGFFKYEVYFERLLGFVDDWVENKVLKFYNSIYGFK